jgi:hypothetical protein
MSSAANTIDSKKPTTKQELITANIKLLIEQPEAGHSEALTDYLTAMSRFHNYSLGNVLEIARQMPTATRVAGFWTWKNLGRAVNAGAKGIRILAPIVGVRRKKDKEAENDITKQNERALLGFRNTYVFDISQTNGVDLPEFREVSGDPGESIDRLAAFLRAQGIQLVYNDTVCTGSRARGAVAKSRCDPSETSTCWGLSAYQVQPTAPCDTNVFVARKLFLMNTLSRVDWGGDDNQEGFVASQYKRCCTARVFLPPTYRDLNRLRKRGGGMTDQL